MDESNSMTSLNDVCVEIEKSDKPAILIPEVKEEDIVPSQTDPAWSDYVLKQFEEDEMIDGNPTVDGLRRVTEKLLGEIIESRCSVIVAPIPANDFSATVEHEVRIKIDRNENYGYDCKTFRETADVNILNCDPEFRRFATSTASTRAEARALRKALKLKRVVAAEEVTEVAPETTDNPGKITKNQVNFLVQLCKRNNINLWGYVNMGTNKYEKLDDIPYGTALKMVGVLSDFQRNPGKIKDAIKGWDENWNKK